MNKIVITLLIIFVIYSLTRREKFTNTPPDELNDEDIDLSGYEKSDISISHDLIQEIILRTNEQVSKRTGLCTYIIETVNSDIYENKDPENPGKIFKGMFMVVKYGKGGFDFGFIVSAVIRIINMGPRYDINELEDENDVEMEKDLIEVIEKMENKTLRTEIEDARLKKFKRKYTQFQNMKKELVNEKPSVVILSLRTHPININKPDNEGIFTNNISPREFEDYSLIRESEISYIKNNTNYLVEKEIQNYQDAYGKPKNVPIVT